MVSSIKRNILFQLLPPYFFSFSLILLWHCMDCIGQLSEVHIPIDRLSRKPKGFAYVTFMFPEHAAKAFEVLDGSTFQGRILHLHPSKAKVTWQDLINGLVSLTLSIPGLVFLWLSRVISFFLLFQTPWVSSRKSIFSRRLSQILLTTGMPCFLGQMLWPISWQKRTKPPSWKYKKQVPSLMSWSSFWVYKTRVVEWCLGARSWRERERGSAPCPWGDSDRGPDPGIPP